MRLVVAILGLFTYAAFIGFPIIYAVDRLV